MRAATVILRTCVLLTYSAFAFLGELRLDSGWGLYAETTNRSASAATPGVTLNTDSPILVATNCQQTTIAYHWNKNTAPILRIPNGIARTAAAMSSRSEASGMR
jgi:hypothetical protein